MNFTGKPGLFQKNHIRFIELLTNHGEIDVQDAADKIGVSRATIYNYYNYLNGLVLERVKGKIRIRIYDEKPSDADLNESFAVRRSKNENQDNTCWIITAAERNAHSANKETGCKR